MTTNNQPATNTTTALPNDIVITRVFDAPRELVWKAWTEPERMMRWWGPATYTSPAAKMDVREGGKYHLAMQSPAGHVMWTTGVYKEISPMDRLVYTDSFSNENGDVVDPVEFGMPDFPKELLVLLTFEDMGNNQTRMTLIHRGMQPGEGRDGAFGGWNESFDKLEASLR